MEEEVDLEETLVLALNCFQLEVISVQQFEFGWEVVEEEAGRRYLFVLGIQNYWLRKW